MCPRPVWRIGERRAGDVEGWFSFPHVDFQRHAEEHCWRWMAFTRVTPAIDGSSAVPSFCVLYQDLIPSGPTWERLFFLLHLGDALRAQWTLTLGLITLATRNRNNGRALRQLGCNPLNSRKCLNVYLSKGWSLWCLVKSGSTFTDVSVINENCPFMKILQLCPYRGVWLQWQIYTPLFH